MKRLTALLALTASMHACPASAALDPVDYVDPYIGSIGHLLRPTRPIVQLPYCMSRIEPIMTPGVKDIYFADKIYGFPAGASMITAVTGTVAADRALNASSYDHDLENATPYWYSALLEDYDIQAEGTVTEHGAAYRFTFPDDADGALVFATESDGELTIEGDTVLRGSQISSGVRRYFHAVVSTPFASVGTISGGILQDGRKSVSGDNIGCFVTFPSDARAVEVHIGISLISAEQAAANYTAELKGRSFDNIKNRARDIWNEELGRIVVTGGTEKERRIFYTALYRAYGRMINITEDGRYYSGYDKQVHDADGTDFYVDDWLWDTYRAMHPLQQILDPKRKLDMITSYIRMYEQSGWLPLFPGIEGDRPVMIGHHATAMIVDAWMKDLRDFDVETAYEAMKKNAMEATMLPWSVGPMTELGKVYLKQGFFPAKPLDKDEWVDEVHDFERRQAVAVTLEHAYDDWCLAQIAKDLGKDDDYTYFMKRARNYENLYNATTGFMSPKTANGRWIEPFDPKISGGQGGRDYFAECNSWVYTWHVQHDVAGLINLMGGRDTFVKRLDQLFIEQPNIAHFHFLGQFPDMTGLTGLFTMGDEPGFHIPYLYNYAGAPWKTQRRVRDLMRVWFDDDPLGICGDEDGGAMSSWYVLSAMGFYPVCPGQPIYNIASPIFERIEIHPKGGKPLTIVAEGASTRNKYIQSATLDGKSLDRPWFTHDSIVNGGTLTLDMGPRPNKTWGSRPQDAPPSMSEESIK